VAGVAMKALAPTVPRVLAAGALVLLAGCARPAPAPRAVVVVDLDTLRADRLGAYGNPRPTSPHLDAFARGATRFEWAFAQAPYTLPSQVSIVTSLYPHTHGVVREKDRMGTEAATLAEAFRAAGWRTAAFVDGGYVSAPYGFDQGFETFVDFQRAGVAASEAKVAAWLAEHAGEPFLLFVHTYDTHTPYAPPEPFRSRFAAMAPAPTPGFEPTSEALEAIRASQWTPPLERLEPHDLEYARALYDGEIAFVDAWFGRLVRQLEELGVAERAVVAVISDHGEEFQEHGSLLHEKLYTTVTRVPWLIRTPGGVAGQVVAEPVETVDLMPTLLELAGVPSPPGLEGRSLAATVRGGAPPGPRTGLAHSPFWGEQRAIVEGDLHLVLTLDAARMELFDYRTDPLELVDLAASRAREAERLVRAMRARTSALPGTPVARGLAARTPEVDATLRALGYLR
jgi:arylsulfatase A-like enzyme